MRQLNSAAKAAGVAAEQDARWYIDRKFHESKNWRVLHDVLLPDPRSDAWCQIDHIAFGRLGHFLVLETKSAVQGMSLHEENGAWSIWHGGKLRPVKSPIAQNIRHIEVLRDFLKEKQIMPKRLFVSISPRFENWILIQPGSRLPREYEGARLVQRDQFSQEFDLFLERMSDSSMLKLMTGAELDAIAARLEGPSNQNKILRNQGSAEQTGKSTPVAEVRRESPSIACAPLVPSSVVNEEPSAPKLSSAKATFCTKCGDELTLKEIHYCRFNFAKLGRKYLCRKCQ